MKVLAIRGRNLASLEDEFEIDFTKEPLKSAGVYVITGPTGAGKSTILDALCLALFDDIPRLYKAENVKLKVNAESTIGQSDSRNILRKGASDGYAQVDFVALNGDRYRSSWRVRRAKGKVDGSLQPTTMTVENLVTNTCEPGTKTQLLARIVELIGLTFNQFTRAVLLAQGEFANFLKAKSSDKAELLEKLTGTDIYSKISERIYRNTQQAANSLAIFKERINDIKLLSDQDYSNLQNEKERIEKQLIPLKDQSVLIDKKLTWCQQQQQIQTDLKQAQEEFVAIQQKIEQAKSRYDYIDKLDASMEVRDTYHDLIEKRATEHKLLNEVLNKEKELETHTFDLTKISTQLALAKDNLDQQTNTYQNLKPDIKKAQQLDYELKTLEQKITALVNEIRTFTKRISESNQQIETYEQQADKIREEQHSINDWFASNHIYTHLIPKVELINRTIDLTLLNQKYKEDAINSLSSSQRMLQTSNDQLKLLEDEAERLNKLLPSEILRLRNTLEDDKACLVCGSTHHPYKDHITQDQLFNEKELEEKKLANQADIADTKASIERTQQNIYKFDSHIINFAEQLEENLKNLQEHLHVLPNWRDRLGADLKHELEHIASIWNSNTKKLEDYTNQLKNLEIKIEAEQKNKHKDQEMLFDKQDQQRQVSASVVEANEQRNALLGGKSVDEIENHYSALITQLTKQHDQLRDTKEKYEKLTLSLSGSIDQLRNDIQSNKDNTEALALKLNQWVNTNTKQISKYLLVELLSKSREWMLEEKKYLSDLKNHELIVNTTLAERKNRLLKHQQSAYKPSDTENKESLAQQLIDNQHQLDNLSKELSQVKVTLLSHEQAKERLKTFEAELNLKTEQYENWAKLNALLGSSDGSAFKKIAQGYTLDVLLSYANRHLQDLNQRYKLEKIPDSLAIQVVDQMYCEQRSVHSLSGGESFLISLALALGLSSLSSERISIESLFIDEGFGSLDVDTLSVAMDALDNLHILGRKIGVISHVEEMKERITTQIQVIKQSNGKGIVRVVG